MLNLPRFLKRFIRKNTRPKAPGSALQTRSKISLLYAVITWNLLGLIVYKIVRKNQETNAEEKVSDGRYFAEMLGLKNVTLKRFSGFTKVGEWDLEEEKRIHGKLLTELELAKLKNEQESKENQGEQQQQSDWKENEDLNVERPL